MAEETSDSENKIPVQETATGVAPGAPNKYTVEGIPLTEEEKDHLERMKQLRAEAEQQAIKNEIPQATPEEQAAHNEAITNPGAMDTPNYLLQLKLETPILQAYGVIHEADVNGDNIIGPGENLSEVQMVHLKDLLGRNDKGEIVREQIEAAIAMGEKHGHQKIEFESIDEFVANANGPRKAVDPATKGRE